GVDPARHFCRPIDLTEENSRVPQWHADFTTIHLHLYPVRTRGVGRRTGCRTSFTLSQLPLRYTRTVRYTNTSDRGGCITGRRVGTDPAVHRLRSPASSLDRRGRQPTAAGPHRGETVGATTFPVRTSRSTPYEVIVMSRRNTGRGRPQRPKPVHRDGPARRGTSFRCLGCG